MRSTILKCTLDPIRGCNGRAPEFRKTSVEVAVPSSRGEVIVAEKMERGGWIWDTCSRWAWPTWLMDETWRWEEREGGIKNDS